MRPSEQEVQRSNLAGWGSYGYCASHSRFFWGLRLYLVCTPAGMPIMWALAIPKIGEREVLAAMLEIDADLIAEREGILLISDKGFASKPFEKELAEQGIELLRPSRKREKQRYGEPMLKKVRQLIESVNDTLKGQLNLEQHGGLLGPVLGRVLVHHAVAVSRRARRCAGTPTARIAVTWRAHFMKTSSSSSATAASASCATSSCTSPGKRLATCADCSARAVRAVTSAAPVPALPAGRAGGVSVRCPARCSACWARRRSNSAASSGGSRGPRRPAP
ncbi:transposase [Nonomuraea sp. NPDC049028]|uniref:transposase n=1 Tax=Nonomuraea sp. NPDC049028 TaxID=3364348 RepID=UPI003715520D